MPCVCSETNELGEELVGSYLYQVHLHHRFYLLDRSDFELGRDFCAAQVRFIEQGKEPDPQAKKQRARILARALRKLGHNVAISPMNPPTAESATPTQ